SRPGCRGIRVGRSPARGMESPQTAEPARYVRILADDFRERRMSVGREFSRGGAFFQYSAGVANPPVIRVQLQLHQLGVDQGLQIECTRRLCSLTVSDFVNPATRTE